MALFRSVGNPVIIAAGATHYWHYWFGRGSDVGVTMVTPNLLDSQINVELVTEDPGVVAVQDVGENPPAIHYTVRVRNLGNYLMMYNLNVGTLL
ncbi:hypothetical protein DSM104443_01065 [Usitatibacter rugosus]|jgi:hypothetical protein|uniref:Uncharacterized protein n=1 Tax=Usitatibacter rugosus TaxID=2732067 RepID=A0A6M4GU50_9PROT|nr:hypothetical protein [Usitatibacter rugosus]QJR10014.1 hypothetical protein DSM104443_01065 [Usitatibacter rugosus]